MSGADHGPGGHIAEFCSIPGGIILNNTAARIIECDSAPCKPSTVFSAQNGEATLFFVKRHLLQGGTSMLVRSVLPAAAIGLALVAPGQLAAQSPSPTQIRPAQMAQTGRCDDLLQQVESRMNTALAVNAHGAAANLRQARELCNSGHPEQGIPMLHRLLFSMNNN